ncbi:MAG TPA: DUF4097 family beta strand repeat-containing protein [Longimicrobiales bacterium]|nr:DUF4097 family beta strand repeat-containing protein [Longimicrobiales bacterium]
MMKTTLTLLAAVAIAPALHAQESYTLNSRSIAVSNSSGEIRVERGTGSSVTVCVERHGRNADELEIETKNENGVATLRVVHPPNQGRRFEADADLTVRVPEGMNSVSFSSASGDVTVVGIGSDELSAHTASGSVTARNVRADVLDLSTASGSVRVEGATAARVKAHTASGDVRVDLNGNVRDVNASTASGSIEIGVPAAFSGEVEMSTASGDMETDFPMQVITKRRNSLRARIGDGSAHVALHTASGDVRLVRR